MTGTILVGVASFNLKSFTERPREGCGQVGRLEAKARGQGGGGGHAQVAEDGLVAHLAEEQADGPGGGGEEGGAVEDLAEGAGEVGL